MFQKGFTDSFIYRQRHVLGFVVLGFLLYYFLAFGFARIPAGLSASEIQSAILSTNLVFPDSVVNFLYHLVQRVSIDFFGVSTFSIRWPSVVLALASGVLIIATVRNLFKSNVAIITGMITVSSVLFLNVARSGSPMIMSVFLLILATFAFSQYLTNKTARSLWLILTALALVLATYSPLGIYFLVCSVLIAIFHPRVRAVVLRFKVHQIVLICLAGILLLAPLVVAIAFQSSILMTILGLDNLQLSLSTVTNNLAAILLPWNNTAGFVTPIISLVELAIAAIGIVGLWIDRHSARSYLTIALTVVGLVFVVIDIRFSYMLLIPLILLVAIGINTLIRSWYGLFPTNPVARLAGLVPLTVLIVGLVATGHTHFVNSNLYNADIVHSRDHTFEAVSSTVNQYSGHTINLVVSENEIELYGLLGREYPNLVVSQTVAKGVDTVILVPSTFDKKDSTPSRVITGWTSQNNVLVKIFEN